MTEDAESAPPPLPPGPANGRILPSLARATLPGSARAAICATLRDGGRQISGIERPGSTICGASARAASPKWLETPEHVEVNKIDLSSEVMARMADPFSCTGCSR